MTTDYGFGSVPLYATHSCGAILELRPVEVMVPERQSVEVDFTISGVYCPECNKHLGHEEIGDEYYLVRKPV